MLNLCSTYCCKDIATRERDSLRMRINMKNKEYTKINLRDFRHNLTQLKDSLVEIYEKGTLIGYYIPEEYTVQIKRKQNKLTQESFKKALNLPVGTSKLSNDVDYKEEYRRLLEEKYLK